MFSGGPVPKLITASAKREWMQATNKRFANRCLPLLIANQFGWMVLNPYAFSAVWDGGDSTDAVVLTSDDSGLGSWVSSHFGHGVITWRVPYLFRTPPGYGVHVRGPANLPKDGVYALEGLVETDWTCSTFTMNWKMTRPNHEITFDKDEPVAMISPIRRSEIEEFDPIVRLVETETEVQKEFLLWRDSRDEYVHGKEFQAGKGVGWQRHYFQGGHVSGAPGPENHQTKLNVRDFKEHVDDFPPWPGPDSLIFEESWGQEVCWTHIPANLFSRETVCLATTPCKQHGVIKGSGERVGQLPSPIKRPYVEG